MGRLGTRWRPAPRWRAEGGGRRRRALGSQAAGQRAAPATKRGRVASPSGNRTPVSRVTGGDTHHYTNEDGGHRPRARPLSGCLPTPPPALRPPAHHGRPARARPDPTATPTASSKAAAPDPDRDPDPRGPENSECALPIASDAGIAPGGGGPRRKARLRGGGGRAPGHGRRGDARVGAGGRGLARRGPAASGARAGRGRHRGAARRVVWPCSPSAAARPLRRSPRRPRAWRGAPRPAKGTGVRVASGPSQPSGHAHAQARRQDGRAV